MKHILALTAALIFLLGLSAPAAVRYVSASSTNPTPPYTSWDTAASIIQDAVDAASDGDEIVVTNGVYATGGRAVYGTMTNRVAIDKAVTVRSVNGPELTFIVGQGVGEGGTNNGDGAIRCVYVGTNAVLSGFTLTNGHTRVAGDSVKEQGGGGAFCARAAKLTNCVFLGNSAFAFGGGACCIRYTQYFPGDEILYSVKLENCIFIRNLAGSGGGAYGGAFNNCKFTNNVAQNGGGTYHTLNSDSGGLTNCIYYSNSASQRGGGAYGAIMENCDFIGNTADEGGGAAASSLSYCKLISNSAARSGGGASGTGAFGSVGYGYLRCCTLIGNSAGGGGGVYDLNLFNCTLISNSANTGGGASLSEICNCTLVGNSAARYGGGTFMCAVRNSIVYYNTAQVGPNHDTDYQFGNTCTTPLPLGTGNITNLPLFIGTNEWADLRLQSKSPCVDAGNNAWSSDTRDLDGNLRLVGVAVDLGAYEYQSAASLRFDSWLQQFGFFTGGTDDLADPDLDGLNNLQEWRCGTDPTNAASALRLLAPQANGANVRVQWQSVGGKSYFLERSTNLSATPPFQILATNLPGVSGRTGYTDTNPPVGPLFYRIGLGN